MKIRKAIQAKLSLLNGYVSTTCQTLYTLITHSTFRLLEWIAKNVTVRLKKWRLCTNILR